VNKIWLDYVKLEKSFYHLGCSSLRSDEVQIIQTDETRNNRSLL